MVHSLPAPILAPLPGSAEALHVKAGKGGMRYKKGPMSFSGNLLPLYSELMKKYRMLIYSGDTDACGKEATDRAQGQKRPRVSSAC